MLQDRELLCCQMGVLKELPVTFHSYVPKDSFPGDFIQHFLIQPEACSPEVQGLDSALYQPYILWDHKLNQGMDTTAWTASSLNLFNDLFQWSALVSTRSRNASPLVMSCTLTRKLSSTDSRDFLACLQLTVLLFQQLKSPSGWACEHNTSCSWRKKALSISSPWSGSLTTRWS